MAEYIKRMSAMTICERYSQHCFETNDNRGQDIADRIFDEITGIPTANVVEVVRCKECKYNYGVAHSCEFNSEDIVCTYWESDGLDSNDFCSQGKRKDGTDNA